MPAPRKQGSTANSTKPLDPAAELDLRIKSAQAAVKIGNPDQIKAAESRVVGFALSELAELRLVEGANAQALELYRQAITFEDTPDKHVKMAVAFLHMDRFSESLLEVDKAISTSPENVDAWKVKGHALASKEEYNEAAAAFAHALKLKGEAESAYSLAVCFLSLHQNERARMVFQDMIANFGDSGPLHATFGRAYRDAGDDAKAIQEFEKAIALNPKTPHAHYFLGLLLLKRNEWVPDAKVRTLMKQELELSPNDFLANYMLGVFASSDRQYAEAQRYLNTAVNVNPSWPDAFVYLGMDAYETGNYEDAEKALRKAVELTGSDEARNQYQIRKAYIDLGHILQRSGRDQEAETFFQKARDLQQRNLGSSQQALATFMASSGGTGGMGAIMPLMGKKDEERAAPELAFGDATRGMDASTLDRANLTRSQKEQATGEEKYLRSVLGSSYNDLGTSEAKEGQFASALSHFQEAEKWDTRVPGLLRNLGIAAFRVNNYPEACRALQQVITSNPDDGVIRAMLGLSLYMNGSYPEAAKTIAALGDRALEDPALAYPLASSLARAGDFTEATVVLNKLDLLPLTPETVLLVAQTWAQVGNYDKSVAATRRALDHDPTLPGAHYQAGLAYIRSDRPADAVPEFQAELSTSPNNADAKYNLAYAYLQQAQPEKAVPLLREVIATVPSHADAHYELGKTLLDENQLAEATSQLEAAARLAPEKDYIHYQLQVAYRKQDRLQDADRELQLYKQAKAQKLNQAVSHPEQNQ